MFGMATATDWSPPRFALGPLRCRGGAQFGLDLCQASATPAVWPHCLRSPSRAWEKCNSCGGLLFRHSIQSIPCRLSSRCFETASQPSGHEFSTNKTVAFSMRVPLKQLRITCPVSSCPRLDALLGGSAAATGAEFRSLVYPEVCAPV